jgi:hypothetical protein
VALQLLLRFPIFSACLLVCILFAGKAQFSPSTVFVLITLININSSIIYPLQQLLLQFRTPTCDTIIAYTPTPSTAMFNCSFTTTTNVFNYLMFSHFVRLATRHTHHASSNHTFDCTALLVKLTYLCHLHCHLSATAHSHWHRSWPKLYIHACCLHQKCTKFIQVAFNLKL